MDELKRLSNTLKKSGKDEAVRLALDALLAVPDDLDRQIDVLGIAHQAGWFANRKRVFWRTFSIDNPRWANRCIKRVLTSDYDMNALCALLNADVLIVAKAVQPSSPDLVDIWDNAGAETCGLGFAHYGEDALERSVFDRYFYIGWRPIRNNVTRLDYIRRIEAPPGQRSSRLDHIDGIIEIKSTGMWAELPARVGYWTGKRRSFFYVREGSVSNNATAFVRHQLGYMTERASM